MGKRKYKDEEDGSTKRNKKSSVSEDEKEQPQSQKNYNRLQNQPVFDIKHFRKELSEKQGQTMALTQFLQVCLNPDSDMDYLAEYLRVGGNSHEILRQISLENKKNLSLATPTFHIFHLIILKVQSSMPHMITITEEACRYFLNTFIPTVEIMISENSGPRHRKIILNLLTSMVTLSSELGVEVLNQVPLTPKHLQYILEKPNYKEKDNVRTAFVHFMTSFLVDSNLQLIKALLEKQGLLSLVIPGLISDESDAVLMFLNILKKNVIDNILISKTLKLKTFNHQVLHNLFKIFSWKGPPELSNDIRNEARPEIMTLLSNIIITLFTSHKFGLYFIDPYFGTGETNKNQNLYKALLSLKRPWENSYECDTVLEIVFKCPGLHRAIIHVLEQSFQPHHSPIWERAIEFMMKLTDKLKPEDMLPRLNNFSSMQTVNFIRFITLPVPLLKLIQSNIGKDQTISLYCIKVLVKMLYSLKRYITILSLKEADETLTELRNKLDYFIPKHVPAPSIIVSLINDVISGKEPIESSQDYKLPKLDTVDSLLALIDTLLLYNYIHPSFFETLESSIDMMTILDFTKTLCKGEVSLLKFKVVSLWLTLDSSALSLKNPIFKDLFLIMLEVFTCKEENIWIEAKDILQNFLKNTQIYEKDEDEIQLMLYSLRKIKIEPISLVADVIEYILENKEDLIENMRKQMINFEITDAYAESNLDKLFTDLMNNRSTNDSMFLENKLPSPFIIGCMQYIQNNKEAKKSLKGFLSLYIANLLHCNYSPELSEVLIGDSKLEVRSYITACTLNLITLPDTIVQDNVLLKLSESILNEQEDDVKFFLTFIEESSEDNFDLIINDKYYKIALQHLIDTSELFIWARYLMFCIVRLSKLDELTEFKIQKIMNYFKIIIAIGRRHHLVSTCRNILLNLFRNAHFLNMFKAVETSKKSCILTTDFMLEMMVQNKDIIGYLDKNHFLLKLYQHKTYLEVTKAFIKINKKRNVKCDHTIRVLEIVGLSKENDSKIFEKIFEADLNLCINDDKEPSLVVEVLRVLIDKYCSSVTLELSTEVVLKSIKLYFNLITNKDMVANLSSLEKALTKYFENKPHHAALVPEEEFKKIFKACNIRKPTATLATVILKYNAKLCKVFQEQLNTDGILSQRELTLPLGNAVLYHNQFLIENHDLLVRLYNEYKTNINKYIEKPHKAGQVYVQEWKLIRKLVIECMSIEECHKLFSKTHKFEILDANHLKIIQTVLLKIYVINDEEKLEYFCNYLLSMLHLIGNCFKDENLDNLDIAVSLISSATQIDKIKILSGNKDDLKKVVESGTWKNFCKGVLKNGLKVKTGYNDNATGPSLLCLLTTLIKMLYPPDHEEIVDIFEMLTSHSEFLNVMLSRYSVDIKLRLLQLLFCLTNLNKSIMKPQQIPVFLSAYHATKHPCDRLILSILQFYESNGLPVNEYKPYVWGDSAANYYAVRKKRTASLWSHPTPNQVLNLFDREIIDRTIKKFPVNQKLDYYYELPNDCDTFKQSSLKKFLEDELKLKGKFSNKSQDTEAILIMTHRKGEFNKVLQIYNERETLTTSHEDDDDNIYDPAFLFPLLSHLLAPGSMASCFKVMRTGLLSVTLMALSSSCPMMRAAAYHVLHRFCMLLELETRHKNDKLLLTDFITTLRQSVTSALKNAPKEDNLGDLRNPKLPAVGALYLARALTVCTAPSEPLYKPVNNFLIAKQNVDLTIVPDFLSLFHDNEVECTERRLWILDVMTDGIKTMKDVIVIFKSMCIKMLMDFYTTVLCDKKTKVKILSVFNSIVSIPRALEILVEGHGLLSWLHSIIWYLGRDDKSVVQVIINLLNTIIVSMNINTFGKQVKLRVNDVKVKGDEEYEILSIIYELLNYVDVFDLDEVIAYVKLYNAISKRTIKFLTKRQIVNVINRCGRKLKDGECMKLITQSVQAENAQMIKSKIVDTNTDSLIKELHLLAVTYIT